MRAELKKRVETAEAQEREQSKALCSEADKLIAAIKQERQRVNSKESSVAAATAQILAVHEEKLAKIVHDAETRAKAINEAQPPLQQVNTLLRGIASRLEAQVADA